MTTPTEITVPLPHAAHEVAALQREAELEAQFPDFGIDSPEEYTVVDAWLTTVVRKKDAVEAMEKTATAPLNATLKTIRGWFAPVRVALETTEKRLKSTMSAYRVAQHERERQARELVATSTGAELVAALAEATAAPPAGRATTSFVWVVDRVVPDLLPDEWWAPNMQGIAKVAREHKGDDPPVIPGVVFRREARIGARR